MLSITKRWNCLSKQLRYEEPVAELCYMTDITVTMDFSLQVLSVIKWKGPKSNKLTSKFWKQMVYEMPARQKEMLSRDQVN